MELSYKPRQSGGPFEGRTKQVNEIADERRRGGLNFDLGWEGSPFFRSLVFLQKTENLRGNGWGLEHLGCRLSG